MPRSVLYRIIIYVVALTVLVLGGTFLFGGFEGLSGHGVGALIAGVAVSLALGVGLMVLMYASSREHDEAAHRAAGEGLKNESDRKPEED